ncbi:hypothetical protein [Aneurinibacillus tyrosinisolvens]|uniref:hypothetical protein n=1 Tax=Aneurinibacillus tyrosinisolvens TaxID=1443435 RepID=UPI00128CB42E|nr:hypothetical protein [Aneurinibacillus tyrosinisolvens]
MDRSPVDRRHGSKSRFFLCKRIGNKKVKLEGLAKPVKVEQVTLVRYGKGFHMTAPIHPLPTPVGA